MNGIHDFFFSKRKSKKFILIDRFSYTNCCLFSFLFVSLIIILPVMWCIGVITLYVVNRGYDFQTGECDSGIFCNNNEAYCSNDNIINFILGCTAFGLMTTAFISVGIIVIMIVIFLLFKLFQYIYKKYILKKNDSDSEVINPKEFSSSR